MNPNPHPSNPLRLKGLNRLNAISVLGVVAGLACLLGCGRDQVKSTRVEKSSPQTQGLPPGHPPLDVPAGVPGAMPPAGMKGQVPPPPRPSAGSSLKWTLPKGWSEIPGSGMRFATLKPPFPGKVEASVVTLPGPAGGELANVNRWRAQLGLPPIDEQALDSARKTVKSKAGPVALFDLTSEGEVKSRMVVGLLSTSDGNTWFLKLTGDAGTVGQAKAEFVQLLGTLHLD